MEFLWFHSPILSTATFVFQKIKLYLTGRHFGTGENIETVVPDQLKVIAVSDFQHCYEEWKQRLRRCVAFEGNYFEGDKLDLYFKNKYRVRLNQPHYFI
jgi:hypothetical protein